MEGIGHFLDGGEDILIEIFIATQFGTAHINELEGFASECNRAVLIEEDGDVGTRLDLLFDSLHYLMQQQLLVAGILAFAK